MAYGQTGLYIDLPDEVPITIIEPEFVSGYLDEPAEIIAALRKPVGTKPLQDLVKPDDQVAIVFSDLTRPMPNERVLPPLLHELEIAGISEDNIILINALGTHRPQTDEELKTMLGEEIINRYAILQHNAWDNNNLVFVTYNHAGRPVYINRAYMKANVRILTGFIEPHLFAGFSGGPKAVLPGIADIESILDNHGVQMLSSPKAALAITEGNPVWEEIFAVAESTNPSFLLNIALNRDRQIIGVFAGALLQAFNAGVDLVKQTAMQPVSNLYDIVITSNSGYPLDLNFYQTIKGEAAAYKILKPGGHILIVAECWEGIPANSAYQSLLWEAISPKQLLDRICTPGFRRHDQWVAQIHAQILQNAKVHLFSSGLTTDEKKRAMVIPCESIEATVTNLLIANPTARIAVLPEGPQTVPFVSMEGW